MWSALAVQSEWHMIYRLVEACAREAKDDLEDLFIGDDSLHPSQQYFSHVWVKHLHVNQKHNDDDVDDDVDDVDDDFYNTWWV